MNQTLDVGVSEYRRREHTKTGEVENKANRHKNRTVKNTRRVKSTGTQTITVRFQIVIEIHRSKTGGV